MKIFASLQGKPSYTQKPYQLHPGWSLRLGSILLPVGNGLLENSKHVGQLDLSPSKARANGTNSLTASGG
jgi:hypothetical protein